MTSFPSSSVAPSPSLVASGSAEFSAAKDGEVRSVSSLTASSLAGLNWTIGSPLPAKSPLDDSNIFPSPLMSAAIDDRFFRTIEDSLIVNLITSAGSIVLSTGNSDFVSSSSQPVDILLSPLIGVSADEEFTITLEPSIQMMPISIASSLISGDAVVRLIPPPKLSGITVATSLSTLSEAPQGNAIQSSLLGTPIVEGIMETIEPSEATRLFSYL